MISKPDRLLNSKNDSLFLFKLTAVGYLIYKLSTLKLWFLLDRTFPIVSISNHFEIVNSWFHILFSALSMILLVLLIFRTVKLFIVIFLIAESLLLLTDVMRWQPAVFQFFISFIAFLYAPKKFKFYVLFLLSATYFYGGLHKVNFRFINVFWARGMLVEFLNISPEIAYTRFIKAIGLIIPVFEIFCGLLLLTKWRNGPFTA